MLREEGLQQLAADIARHRSAIVEAWRAEMHAGSGTTRVISAEHLPPMLDQIAAAIATGDESVQPMKGLANAHALARLRAGYGLREVIAEFRTLRRVVIAHLQPTTQDAAAAHAAVALLHDVIDRAVMNAVEEYTEERDRTRDRFISILSHDLAQPLNAIKFGAQTLVGEAAAGSVARTTATLLVASAGRMHQMIGDLLEFARGRAGQGMPLAPQRLNSASLMCRVTQEISTAHPDRAIQCMVADRSDEDDVEWDETRMTQALSNVLTNALTHGQDPIVLQAARREDLILIEVRNRGEIPPEVLPRLFEPFTGGTGRSGLGLGLYIVDRVVAAHGGTIRVGSSDGVTTVHLAVPRQPPAESATPHAARSW